MASGVDRPEALDWSALFVRYRTMAVRSVQGIVGNVETAEDLVQEAFRSIIERDERGELSLASSEHARNYLFRALHNLAVDHLRSPSRRTGELAEPDEVAAATADGGAALSRLEQREAREVRARLNADVTQALESLKPAEAEAVRLRYGEGLRYREIAERTGASISTLQGRVEAALNKIRGKLGKGAELP